PRGSPMATTRSRARSSSPARAASSTESPPSRPDPRPTRYTLLVLRDGGGALGGAEHAEGAADVGVFARADRAVVRRPGRVVDLARGAAPEIGAAPGRRR